jgi:uncharacterized membrane protein (DUF2068 family)
LQSSTHAHAKGVRSIAAFEASKGILVLLVGFGLLHLVHHDLQTIAEKLVRLGHLNPARHYPRVFIDAASRTSDARLKTLAALAFFYSIVRFVEAYGLWHMRGWAEWFAIISGGIYIPLEVFEIAKHASGLRVLALLVNIAIVTYLLYVRLIGHQERSSCEVER